MDLPKDISPEYFAKHYRLQSDEWREAIGEICKHHGIPFSNFQTFSTESSNLIACVADNTIIKVFPPFHRHQWESERRVLARFGTHDLSLSVPKIIAQGERMDSWTYVIMSRVTGQPLETIWSSLSRGEKAAIMREIGQLMARVHGIPVGELRDLDPEWNQFIETQLKQCSERHRRLGSPDWFLTELPQYLKEGVLALPQEEPVILTGEYTPFNLLVERGDRGWKLSGMIDFGDSMVGFREYDFDGPCLFLGEGDPLLIGHLFEGYGYPTPCTNAPLRRRLMLLAVLHRYSNLKLQIRIPGIWNRVQSMQELEDHVFPPLKQIVPADRVI